MKIIVFNREREKYTNHAMINHIWQQQKSKQTKIDVSTKNKSIHITCITDTKTTTKTETKSTLKAKNHEHNFLKFKLDPFYILNHHKHTGLIKYASACTHTYPHTQTHTYTHTHTHTHNYTICKYLQ